MFSFYGDLGVASDCWQAAARKSCACTAHTPTLRCLVGRGKSRRILTVVAPETTVFWRIPDLWKSGTAAHGIFAAAQQNQRSKKPGMAGLLVDNWAKRLRRARQCLLPRLSNR